MRGHQGWLPPEPRLTATLVSIALSRRHGNKAKGQSEKKTRSSTDAGRGAADQIAPGESDRSGWPVRGDPGDIDRVRGRHWPNRYASWPRPGEERGTPRSDLRSYRLILPDIRPGRPRAAHQGVRPSSATSRGWPRRNGPAIRRSRSFSIGSCQLLGLDPSRSKIPASSAEITFLVSRKALPRVIDQTITEKPPTATATTGATRSSPGSFTHGRSTPYTARGSRIAVFSGFLKRRI